MHAIEITQHGGADVLLYGASSGPVPALDPQRLNAVGQRYPLKDAAQAHRDLEDRKTHGSTSLVP
jgi:hypothetical protein